MFVSHLGEALGRFVLVAVYGFKTALVAVGMSLANFLVVRTSFSCGGDLRGSNKDVSVGERDRDTERDLAKEGHFPWHLIFFYIFFYDLE